jgi:hypothetical protein
MEHFLQQMVYESLVEEYPRLAAVAPVVVHALPAAAELGVRQ